MQITKLISSTILISLIAITTSASAFSTRTESWIEEALLHDGRIIKVNREVGSTLQVFSGDGGSPGFMKSWPDKYWLKFTNPDTQETIKWQGEQNFNPILLDIVGGVPYLVVNGSPDKKTEEKYGCPELPFIYLKYEMGVFGKWIPILASKAPKTLQKTNLSLSHPDHLQHGGLTHYYLSYKDIQNNISVRDKSLSNGKIPTSYEEWDYPYKTSYITNRKKNDCRPPRQEPNKAILPSPQKVTLEIIEKTEYVPDLTLNFKEWRQMFVDVASHNLCNKAFKATDPKDSFLGERFSEDISGQKIVPYDKLSNVRRICDSNTIWFLANTEEKNKMIISKYSITGNLIYRISFNNPVNTSYINEITEPSIRSENGFLYFDWVQINKQSTNMWHVKQILKIRVQEPI